MKKIVVLSDTHKNISYIEKLLPVMLESDYVIHLGDHISDMDKFKGILGNRFIGVAGNCDFFSSSAKEIVLQIEEVKLLICHGHKYGVKSGLTSLYLRAKELGCSLALYGHTHIADIKDWDGIKLVNPGCGALYSAFSSYCYIIISGEKSVCKIN